MKRIYFVFIMGTAVSLLCAQTSDQFVSFQFSKAPNTAHLEAAGGKSFAMEIDYLNMAASSEGVDVSVNMFGLNPVFNWWNGKNGIVLSIPVSYLTAETEQDTSLESSGLVVAPSLGGVLKLAGEIDNSNLMGFGGMTITPASMIWLWNDLIDLFISMPSVSFHVGLKGHILMDETFTLVPFFMVNATQAWVTVDMTNYWFDPPAFSSESVTTPVAIAPVIGLDILIMEYSLGAMFDFKEDSSSFSLHFRVPINKSYTG